MDDKVVCGVELCVVEEEENATRRDRLRKKERICIDIIDACVIRLQ